jgi:transposase-like protein
LLYALALARRIVLEVRAGFEDGPLVRARLRAENDRLKERVAVLEEELRIKDGRMARIAPSRRPHYPPPERLAIVTLRAAAGWSAAQTARRFLLTAATIASWMQRLDEQGPEALVRTAAPVNRLPDFVTALVERPRAPSRASANVGSPRCSLAPACTSAPPPCGGSPPRGSSRRRRRLPHPRRARPMRAPSIPAPPSRAPPLRRSRHRACGAW